MLSCCCLVSFSYSKKLSFWSAHSFKIQQSLRPASQQEKRPFCVIPLKWVTCEMNSYWRMQRSKFLHPYGNHICKPEGERWIQCFPTRLLFFDLSHKNEETRSTLVFSVKRFFVSFRALHIDRVSRGLKLDVPADFRLGMLTMLTKSL